MQTISKTTPTRADKKRLNRKAKLPWRVQGILDNPNGSAKSRDEFIERYEKAKAKDIIQTVVADTKKLPTIAEIDARIKFRAASSVVVTRRARDLAAQTKTIKKRKAATRGGK
jgi:hypothetical protein